MGIIEAGITNEIKHIVETKDLANQFGNVEEVAVFATPMMIALMEQVCVKCVAPYLDEGQFTVGTNVNVNHVSATPAGKEVTFKCTLSAVAKNRFLTFQVSAYDDKGLIGEGTHGRAVIQLEQFLKNLNQ